MGGLFYLGSIVCVLIVIFWFRNNELHGGDGRTGLLAFKDAPEKKSKKRRKSGTDFQ